MNKTTLDLAGLGRYVAGEIVKKAEAKTELPLAEFLSPMIAEGIDQLGLGVVDIDPALINLGKIMIAALAKRKKLGVKQDDTGNSS